MSLVWRTWKLGRDDYWSLVKDATEKHLEDLRREHEPLDSKQLIEGIPAIFNVPTFVPTSAPINDIG